MSSGGAGDGGGAATPLVYFYPHAYLRDRQLDTVRLWPSDRVLNPEVAATRTGAQVGRDASLRRRLPLSWKQRLPLLNVKLRPRGLPRDAVVYLWGGVAATGPFIVDLDNPYSLTGYNLRAMAIYRGVLRRILSSPRCVAIRCLSGACRESLRALFGDSVWRRAEVHYPRVPPGVIASPASPDGSCRFLFVATQFEIKGGVALLRAFRRLHEEFPDTRLDLVTHLPPEYVDEAARTPGVYVHEAHFTRAEIADRFLRRADVLVHPTYIESFGMVVLEALAHGLAVIASDVYALREMVEDGVNGACLDPPVSVWDGVLPSRVYFDLPHIKSYVRAADTGRFEDALVGAMRGFAGNPDRLLAARAASLERFTRLFSPGRSAA